MGLEQRLVLFGRLPREGSELDTLLQARGFQVYTVETEAELLTVLQFSQPDGALLAGPLDMRSLSRVIATSRRAGNSLIVVAWPGVSVSDAVTLLDMGADYVSGSFQPDWLAAQLRASMRRLGRERSSPSVIELGRLCINLHQRQVTVGDREVALTPTEFAVLRMLAERPGTVLPSGETMRQILGVPIAESEAQDLLKVHIHRLRQKLEADSDAPRFIRTVRGHGYLYAFERRSGERANPAVSEAD